MHFRVIFGRESASPMRIGVTAQGGRDMANDPIIAAHRS